GTPRGGCGGSWSAAPNAGRICWPAGVTRELGGVHSGGPGAGGSAGSCAAAWAAGAGEDDAGANRCAGTGRGVPGDFRTGDPKGRGSRRNPDKPPTQGCLIH